MKRLELGMMDKKLLSVKTSELLRDSLKYVKIKCNIDDGSREGTRIYQNCMQIWSRYFSGRQINILISGFGRECIDISQQKLLLDKRCFTCRLLEQHDTAAMTGGFLYLFHAPETETENLNLTDRFYTESWQIALLDAARLWLERYLRRQQESHSYLSEAFGPGFYGMEIEAVQTLVKLMEGEQVGIRLLPDGMMEPALSSAGLFLTSTKKFRTISESCISCQGTRHCRMCRHYTDTHDVD